MKIGMMSHGRHSASTGHGAEVAAYRCIGTVRTGACHASQRLHGDPLGRGNLLLHHFSRKQIFGTEKIEPAITTPCQLAWQVNEILNASLV